MQKKKYFRKQPRELLFSRHCHKKAKGNLLWYRVMILKENMA